MKPTEFSERKEHIGVRYCTAVPGAEVRSLIWALTAVHICLQEELSVWGPYTCANSVTAARNCRRLYSRTKLNALG
jgi:hypothetical protein